MVRIFKRDLNLSVKFSAIILLMIGFTLCSCGGLSKSLGLTKQKLDEFEVARNAPLTLPPDYTLKPPVPGAPRPQEEEIVSKAKEDVFGEQQTINSKSAGEMALLGEANALDVDTNIRRKIKEEYSIFLEEDDSFFEDILFWKAAPKIGTIVDAEAEEQRLKENAALGLPPDVGDTPVIKRREKALLEGIF